MREYDCHERVPVDLDAERDGVRRNRKENMSRAKTLVTGATGMTGSHTVQLLLKRGHEVTPLAECGAIFAKVLDRLARCASRRRNVIGHRTLRMPCATRMGHRAKASHCLILAAGLRTKGSCCDRFDGSTLECNSVVQQAPSKTSLAGGGTRRRLNFPEM